MPISEILVGAALFIAASISLALTRIPGGIALLWPGSAIAAALLIRMPRVRWIGASAAMIAALWLSSVLVAHRSAPLAAAFAAINLTEIGLMTLAFRSIWKLPYPDITVDHAAFMTALFGIIIPGITACIGGFLLRAQMGTPWSSGALQWGSSHVIGACLAGPPLILCSLAGTRRLVRRQFVVENIGVALLCLLGCYLIICYVRFPFVSLGLLLLMAAFRMGGYGASLVSAGVGLLFCTLWMLGVRPLGLDPATSMNRSLLDLPVIALLATVMPPIAVGLGSDARRGVARALRTSERRFRESMAHSPIGMLIADLDGTWRYTNLSLQRMLGYTAEEFRAMPPGGPSKSDDWKQSESRWSRLLAGKVQSYEATREFRHRDGRWLWTNVAVSLLRDDDGKPVHLIAQIESLEERRMAEAALAAERQQLKITLANINDAVITLDADNCITYANPAAEAMLAADLQTLMQRRIDEVVHLVDPQTAKTAANLVGQCAYHGKAFKREKPCLLHRPDGSICYITDVASPVFNETGVLTGLVIVLKDATAEVERGRDLEHRALHDPLTGLSNRADFNDRLQRTFRRAVQTERAAAVIAIDLDRFKAVNDSAGHAAGDAVLCKVAEACRGAVRTSDTVARLGGDEFAVILENCGDERAAEIAAKILKALNPVTIEWGKTTYLVNASLGMAMTATGMADEKVWLRAADQACYAAKHLGRGHLQVASVAGASLEVAGQQH